MGRRPKDAGGGGATGGSSSNDDDVVLSSLGSSSNAGRKPKLVSKKVAAPAPTKSSTSKNAAAGLSSSSLHGVRSKDVLSPPKKKKKVVLGKKGVLSATGLRSSTGSVSPESHGLYDDEMIGLSSTAQLYPELPSYDIDPSNYVDMLGGTNKRKLNAIPPVPQSMLTAVKSAASKKKIKQTDRSITSTLLLAQRRQQELGVYDDTMANNTGTSSSSDCNCYGCTRTRCDVCSLCEESGFLYNTCVLKTCHLHRDYEEEQSNYDEIIRVLTSVPDNLVAGTRVYAAWNPNDITGGWYWGTIVKAYKMKRHYSTAVNEYYTIEFDDGDIKKNVDKEEVWSEYKYKLLTEKLRLESLVPPPVAPASATTETVPSGTTVTSTNPQPTTTTSTGGVRTTSGDENATKSAVPPNGKDEENKDELGAATIEGGASTTTTTNLSVITSKLVPFVEVEWWKRGCGRCTNCSRTACGKCNLCKLGVPTLSSAEELEKWRPYQCYQKMCMKIPEESKFEPAPYFPEGWKFGFTSVASRYTEWNGLVLVAPASEDSKKFRVVGQAMKRMKVFHDTVDSALKFYEYVGLENVPDTILETALLKKNSDDGTTEGVDGETAEAEATTNEEAASSEKPKVRKMARRSSSNFRRSNSNSIKDHIYSNKKEVGARVYAKFTNDEWYWGTIIEIVLGKPEMGYPKYLVQYDDGESVLNLTDDSMVTEKEYFDISKIPPPTPPSLSKELFETSSDCSIPDAEERVSFSLTELFQLRCKSCTACLKSDCDKCMSCQYNKLSTSRNRQVCYFKMCDQISSGEKMQPVPGLPVGWNFYISGEHGRDGPSKNTQIFHPDLAGLCIVPPDCKRVFRSMEDAVKECKFSKDESREKITQFYETLLGIRPRRERSNHQLVGHGYHREWVDGTGKHREVYGTIITCWESLFAPDGITDLYFSVKYDPSVRDVLSTTSLCHLVLPEIDDNVPEHVAWGGFLSFTRKVGMTAIDQMVARNATFHFNWVVPTFRYTQACPDSDLKSVVMFTKGFKLELVAKTSSIPNSGLGLWVRCTAASEIVARNASYFELNAGEAIDLGCYAPTDNIDRRPEHVNLVKAFVHNWDCESWCFEMGHHQRGNDVFDITDDYTGDLHEMSKQNILVYANETDGKETPSLFAEHDPEGAVHYYMGHREEGLGIFRLPVGGEEFELKVDYGPKYENVRVRKGYSRLPVDEAAALKIKLKEDDAEVLQEIQEFSAKDLFDIIVFLENLLNVSHSATECDLEPELYTHKVLPKEKLIRALIIAISLHTRVASILKEFASSNNPTTPDSSARNASETINFCDNGFTDMKQRKAFERSRRLVSAAITQFGSADILKEMFFSEKVYSTFLSELLGTDPIETISAQDIQTQLQDLHKVEVV